MGLSGASNKKLYKAKVNVSRSPSSFVLCKTPKFPLVEVTKVLLFHVRVNMGLALAMEILSSCNCKMSRHEVGFKKYCATVENKARAICE